jgi:hypothetical protein
MCEDPLEVRGSPLRLFYSTLGLDPTTTEPILYFLTAAHRQVRFDVSIGVLVSRSCWQSRTLSLAMMLPMCTPILVSSLWLTSRPQDLVSWPERFFPHAMSIHRVNMHIGSLTVTTCLLWRLPSSILEPHHAAEISISCFAPKIHYVKFCLSLIKNRQPYPADLRHRATIGSLSLSPAKLFPV